MNTSGMRYEIKATQQSRDRFYDKRLKKKRYRRRTLRRSVCAENPDQALLTFRHNYEEDPRWVLVGLEVVLPV